MQKFIKALLLLSLSLMARENPFSEVLSQESFPVSTNTPKTYSHLKNETFRLPDSARIVKKIIIEYQNLDGSIEKLSKKIDKKVDWHMPITLHHEQMKSQASRFVQRVKLPFISSLTRKNQMKLITKDRLIRHFMLPSPHRIVLDFKGSSKVLGRKYTNFTAPFTEIRMGNHDGYYRVVIELDGQYEYKKKEDKHGIILTVK